MSLRNLIVSTESTGVVTVVPEGVDFDVTNDYLSRSSDLVGNMDSKTFTFSCWVYANGSPATRKIYDVRDTESVPYGGLYVEISNTTLNISAKINSTSTDLLSAYNFPFPNNSFVHVLVSMDMSSTGLRKVYINDIDVTGLGTFSTYSNTSINFTGAIHSIAATGDTGKGNKLKGRLSYLFLDHVYRDLSIEANRRLFITAEGKPAEGQKSLNPIIGMSMKDAATAHINDFGTGGNFTLNGTIATSNRGANQDNCVASYFDGSADFLSKTTALAGISNSKVFTISFSYRAASFAATNQIMNFAYGSADRLTVTVSTSGSLQILAYNSSSAVIFYMLTTNGTIVLNKQYHITCSVDLANTADRHMFINGVSFAPTWNIYTDDLIAFNVATYRYYIAASTTGAGLVAENLGELYFDTKYINLATSNPFWDVVENKPIPVRKVITNTGVTPLVAMPLVASNAEKNYGAGGDFTANSAPYVGARGASEYWERTAMYNGTGYLSSTGLTGITDSKALTFVGHVYKSASTLYHLLGSTNSNVSVSVNTTDQLIISAKNSVGVVVLMATVTTTIPNTTWTTVLVSLDLTNTANRAVWLNDVAASVTWAVYTDDFIDFTNASWVVGADVALANKFSGHMSILLDNTYIDFSNEVNRLKYKDGLRFPTDVTAKISGGLLSRPALYLASRDPSNLGVNTGYGGNLTVTATIIQGADVNG